MDFDILCYNLYYVILSVEIGWHECMNLEEASFYPNIGQKKLIAIYNKNTRRSDLLNT